MKVMEEYRELLGLAKKYLLQEHQLNERLYADRETYTYFREFVAQKTAAAPSKIDQSPTPANPLPLPPSPIAVSTQATAPLPKTMPQPPQATREPAPVIAKPTAKQISPQTVQKKDSLLETAVSPAKEAAEVRTASTFVPELPPAVESVEVGEIRKILTERHPGLRFLETIPSDAEAKMKARLWEQEQTLRVILLTFNEGTKQSIFLENMRFAIDAYGWSAKVIKGHAVEKAKGWEALLASPNLHLVIAAGGDLEALTELKKLYRESVQPQARTLGGIPLLLMADPATYMQEPALKAALWKSIKDLLARPTAKV